MLLSYDEFRTNTATVLATIAEACHRAGRNPTEVSLLPVTKTHPAEAVDYVSRHGGLASVGENRVQEAAEKRPLTQGGLRWELIGHLQSNKARQAVEIFDRIQSVDSEKLVGVLAKATAARAQPFPILLQINAGLDPAKFGADPEQAARLLESALAQKTLRVEGLMTIAPLSTDPDVARRTFSHLRELRDQLAHRFQVPLPELSMGMSGDLSEAVAAGSTQVRVGSALFGHRPHTG